MDKICIVKRRQQYSKDTTEETMQGQANTASKSESGLDGIESTKDKTFPGQKAVKEFNDDSGHVVSITLTPEQSTMLQNSEYIQDLLSGAKTDPSMDVQHNTDGRLVLNFRLNQSPLLRMLRSDQVCQMLQISRSFLQKLIYEKKIKSYKLGRMRRFLLEDILEFLLNSEEYTQLNFGR
jgi:excisionase family DNA binding protein